MSLAVRFLPRFVLRWLDPFQQAIASEVETAAAGVAADHVVLDAGAGESRHRRCFRRGRYYALDSGRGDPSWDYSRLDIRGLLELLPLRQESVDLILCIVVLEHVPNPEEVLREFARVLKRGGALYLIVPFLWEEHQAPHDYFRFTRYGVRSVFDALPLQIDLLEPVGGIFWLMGRRCINLLTVFQGGWRWLLFAVLAPLLGLLLPVLLYHLDRLDRRRNFTLGFRVRATKACE